MDKLRDIKPIVEVHDYSFYIFLGVVFICVFLLLFILYYIYKKLKSPKYQFDLNNSKQTAYKLINLIRDKDDSKIYINKLHQYTYKKEVPRFDKKLFEEIITKYKIKVEKKDF